MAKFCTCPFEWCLAKEVLCIFTGYQNFLLFHLFFQKFSFPRSIRLGILWYRVNSLPNNTILGMSKFKARAYNKFGVAEIMGYIFEREENIVGKGENAGYQHFLLILQCFQEASYPGSLKIGIVW